MNNFSNMVVKILMVFLLTQCAIAEEKICAPFPCSDRVDYVTYSRKNANIIIIGTFSFSKISKQIDVGGDRFLEMKFTVKEILKGADVKSQQQIQVQAPISGVAFSDSKINSKLDVFSKWTAGIANLNSDNSNASYDQLEQSIFSEVKDGAASSLNLALMKVSVGGLDFKVREASAPIFEGQDYVLFVFKDKISSDGMLFPWELNVIPFEVYKMHK